MPQEGLPGHSDTRFLLGSYRPCKVLHWAHGRVISMAGKDIDCPNAAPSSESARGNL